MSINLSSISYFEQEPDIAKPLMKELRRADNYIRFAVSTVYDLLSSRLPIDEQKACDWGLIVGTAFGPMETNFDVLGQVVSDDQTSPTLFSHSVFNAAAGYLTRIFNIRGNTATITDFFHPFFQALAIGWHAVHSGRIRCCVILQVETFSCLLQDARSDAHKSNTENWPMGGVAWLLESDNTSVPVASIDNIEIHSTPKGKNNYLHPSDFLTCNDEKIAVTHPLSAPFYLSRILDNQENKKPLYFQIVSDRGIIELQINKPDVMQ